MTTAISIDSRLVCDLSDVGSVVALICPAKGRVDTVHTYVCFIAARRRPAVGCLRTQWPYPRPY